MPVKETVLEIYLILFMFLGLIHPSAIGGWEETFSGGSLSPSTAGFLSSEASGAGLDGQLV